MNKKNRFHQTFVLLFFLIISFFLADLFSLSMRTAFLPQPLSVQVQNPKANISRKNAAQFENPNLVILQKNIFNSDGFIPSGEDEVMNLSLDDALPCRRSISLIGTIITTSDATSIAIVRDRGNSEPQILHIKDRVGDDAQIVAIKRKRIFLRIPGSRRLEYIEIPGQDSLPIGDFS